MEIIIPIILFIFLAVYIVLAVTTKSFHIKSKRRRRWNYSYRPRTRRRWNYSYRPRTQGYSKYSAEDKGQIGENLVAGELGWTKPGEQYLINNVIIETNNKRSSQIDHVFINSRGVWLIETKTFSGTVYGDANAKEWTQVIDYGKFKTRFYNPLIQNAVHIANLKRLLGDAYPIMNLVVFVGTNTNYIKSNQVVSLNDLRSRVWENTGNYISPEEMQLIHDKILKLKNECTVTDEVHVNNVIKLQEDIKNGICPRCGGLLVLRQHKKENGDVNFFYGCSNYPKCKFTKKQ